MAAMLWDDELSQMACLNVKRCVFEHDECRNTARFRYSGQNLATTWWNYHQTKTDRDFILSQLKSWVTEYKNASMVDINNFGIRNNK